MAGHGYSVGKSNSFSRTFEEHGIVMGILSVMPKTAYQQGISRKFKRFDKHDFYWPDFARLGEQEIGIGELYYDYTTSAENNDDLFGYIPRYSEYKYVPASVHGDMRDDFSYWHMGRIFSSAPSLNASFVTSDPTHRVFAVTDPNRS